MGMSSGSGNETTTAMISDQVDQGYSDLHRIDSITPFIVIFPISCVLKLSTNSGQVID